MPATVQSVAVCALITCSSPLAFCTGLPVPASVQKPKWAALKIVLPNSQFQYGSNADTSSRLLVVCISPPLWSSLGRNGILESLSLPVCPSIQLCEYLRLFFSPPPDSILWTGEPFANNLLCIVAHHHELEGHAKRLGHYLQVKSQWGVSFSKKYSWL